MLIGMKPLTRGKLQNQIIEVLREERVAAHDGGERQKMLGSGVIRQKLGRADTNPNRSAISRALANLVSKKIVYMLKPPEGHGYCYALTESAWRKLMGVDNLCAIDPATSSRSQTGTPYNSKNF